MADEPKPDTTTPEADTAKRRLIEARKRFETAAGNLGERVQSVSETTQKRGARFTRRGADLGRRALASATQAGQHVRERHGDKVDLLQESYVQTRDHALGWSDDLSDFVRASPARAVFGAIAAGFLVGIIARRRGD